MATVEGINFASFLRSENIPLVALTFGAIVSKRGLFAVKGIPLMLSLSI